MIVVMGLLTLGYSAWKIYRMGNVTSRETVERLELSMGGTTCGVCSTNAFVCVALLTTSYLLELGAYT